LKEIHLSIHLNINTEEADTKNKNWIKSLNTSEKEYKYVKLLNETEITRIRATRRFVLSRTLLRSISNKKSDEITSGKHSFLIIYLRIQVCHPDKEKEFR